jgi:hypothetical protein
MPDLRLYASNRLEILTGKLAEVLGELEIEP